MKQPLFSVGEEVIVLSTLSPEYNGESVIEDCRWGSIVCTDGTEYTGWVYITVEQPIKHFWYIESSFRKKHRPSDFSFQELMSNFSKEKV